MAAKAPIEAFNAHAQSRGWRHAQLLSAEPSTYNVDTTPAGRDDDWEPSLKYPPASD